MAAGRHLHDFQGHLKEVGALQITPSVLVTGSGDTTVKIWDLTSTDCRVTLRGHSATVMTVQYDGGVKIVSGSYDQTIKLWDLRRPHEPVQTFHEHSGAVFALSIGTSVVHCVCMSVFSSLNKSLPAPFLRPALPCLYSAVPRLDSRRYLTRRILPLFTDDDQIISGSADRTVKVLRFRHEQ